MAEPIQVSGPISGTDKTLSFETGKLAKQSQGAVVARIGDTVVLCTANASKSVREGTDFFPLTVNVEERAYAAGKIPGSFFRREGRPSDAAILTCRLIDRPLRPDVPRRVPQRRRRRRHHPRRRPGEPARRARDQRRIRGAAHLRHPVRSRHRRRADGLHAGRRLDASRHLRGGRRVHLRDRRGRPACRRRRRHHDGRGRRHREGVGLLPGRRPEGHRGAHRPRPRGVRRHGSASPSCCRRNSSSRSARSSSSSSPWASTTSDDVLDRVGEVVVRRHRQGVHDHPEGRAQRGPRRHRRLRAGALAGEFEGRGQGDQGGGSRAHQEGGAHPRRQRRRPHGRSRPRRTCGRFRPRSASSTPRTARASSSGARPRCSTS